MRPHPLRTLPLLLLLVAPPASAERGELELSVGPQALVAASDRVGPLTTERTASAASVRAGYAVLDVLDAYIGYRWTGTLRRETEGSLHTRADLHGVLLGVRARLPLAGSWLRAYAQLELEANLAELTMDVGELRGAQSSWSGGVVPEVGLEARLTITDGFAAIARLGVGYALRLDHRFDRVALDLDAPTLRPLDLGSTNLSGLVVGLTVGARF